MKYTWYVFKSRSFIRAQVIQSYKILTLHNCMLLLENALGKWTNFNETVLFENITKYY